MWDFVTLAELDEDIGTIEDRKLWAVASPGDRYQFYRAGSDHRRLFRGAHGRETHRIFFNATFTECQ